MAGNTAFDEILSTTLKNYETQLADNVFTARPLFYALSNQQTMRTVGGGAKIVVPVLYGKNGTAKSYSGLDPIDVTAQTGISAAEYNWGQFAATVTINGLQEAQNNSTEQIIDLLESKIFQTQESIIESMNAMFFADGTGNGGKDWNGLTNIVNHSTAAGNALGGIDPAAAGTANDWWTSQHHAQGGVLTLAKMGEIYNKCSVGNDQPTIIITTRALYEKYENLLQPQLRYTDTKMADASFQNLVYRAVPVTYDDDCTAGRIYFLNTKYLQLVRHADTWFQSTPFVRPHTLDAVFSQILCYGQLTCSNRARQGLITGATA